MKMGDGKGPKTCFVLDPLVPENKGKNKKNKSGKEKSLRKTMENKKSNTQNEKNKLKKTSHTNEKKTSLDKLRAQRRSR